MQRRRLADRAVSALGEADADHPQPGMGKAADVVDQSPHLVARADDEGPVDRAADPDAPVQEQTPDQVCGEAQRDHGHHRDGGNLPGDVAVGDVGDDHQQRQHPEPGVGDPAEFGRAVGEAVILVGAVDRQHRRPGKRSADHQRHVHGARAEGLGHAEALDHREQDRQRPDDDVGAEQATAPEDRRDLPAAFRRRRRHHRQAEAARRHRDRDPGQVDLITDHPTIVKATDS